jgi:hypothetical protein
MSNGKQAANGVKRQGRRAMPVLRRVRTAKAEAPRALTLGDLVAAAFDVAGDAKGAARLLSSRELGRALGARIVVG